MNETLGGIHFFGLARLHQRGLRADVHRGGWPAFCGACSTRAPGYDFAHKLTGHWNAVSSWGAWIMGLFQIPFIFNFFWSIWNGEKAEGNVMGGHDHRVGLSVACAARQFHYHDIFVNL